MHPILAKQAVRAVATLAISAVAVCACELVSGLDDIKFGMSSGGGAGPGGAAADAGDAASNGDAPTDGRDAASDVDGGQ
jgi:hypothetical protein